MDLKELLTWLSTAILVDRIFAALLPKLRQALFEQVARLDSDLGFFVRYHSGDGLRTPLSRTQRFASWITLCGIYILPCAWFLLSGASLLLLAITRSPEAWRNSLLLCLLGVGSFVMASWLRWTAHKEWEVLKLR